MCSSLPQDCKTWQVQVDSSAAISAEGSSAAKCEVKEAAIQASDSGKAGARHAHSLFRLVQAVQVISCLSFHFEELDYQSASPEGWKQKHCGTTI